MKILITILSVCLLCIGCQPKTYQLQLPRIDRESIRLYPETYTEKPTVPSPAITPDGREVVLAQLDGGVYTWIDVTVENGEPRDYKKGAMGKGNQLLADGDDFPSLARKGLHSNQELKRCLTITGRSVAQITVDGRPGRSSGVGFMASDETILSVLLADNQMVRKLKLSHRDMARPWFHIWNIGWQLEISREASGRNQQLHKIDYAGRKVNVMIEGSRGWQESIFNDEILGSGHMTASRPMEEEELGWLKDNYLQLSDDQLNFLKQRLTVLHTGEMVPYYINRYGFYEGHAEFRIDPVVTAYIFGLRTLAEIHLAADNDLYTYFTTHFTYNPES